MNQLLQRWAAGLCLALLPTLALAQGTPAYQSGPMINAHDLAKITRNGQIQDAGGIAGDATGRGVNPIGILDTLGIGVCSNSARTTGAYNALCLGHDSSGNALLDMNDYGQAAKTMYLKKNGVQYEFPFSVGGIVGPNPTTAGNLMLWNNGTGTAARDAGTMLASILKYGAVSGTDSGAAIQAAITAGCAGGFGIYVPDGDWQTTAMLTIPCSRFKMQGQGPLAHIRYTGGGSVAAAVLITGSSNLWSVELSDMTISANSQASYAVQSWKALHLHLTNLRLRDAAVAGYGGSFGVLNSYKNISVSHNDEAFATIPQNCLKFFDHGDGFGGIYASHIDNLICEGVSLDGVNLATSNDNIFTGGSSEGNGARGVIAAVDTNRNTFNNIDLESNATEDAKDSGQHNQWNNVVSCCVGRFRIAAAANGTIVNGGTFDNITVEANAGTTYGLTVHPGYISNSYAFGGGTSVWDFNGPYTVYSTALACGTGVLTSGAAIGRWRVNAKTAHVMLAGSITTNGTCAGNLQWTLPFVPISLGSPPVNLTCNGVNTTDVISLVGTAFGTLTLNAYKYDSTYPGAGGKFYLMNCTYERQ